MEEIIKLNKDDWPPLLKEIPDPPRQLYLRGKLPSKNNLLFLTIIGPRKPTQQGKEICRQLITALKNKPVVIVSGLALGIDGLAHQLALENNLPTIAIPGSGLKDRVIYPARHQLLAKEIIHKGGALLSEYEPEQRATIYTFPQRNRLMAGISQKVLIIEAGIKSGTLITAHLALEYNRDILVVPGSIFSPLSAGANQLIKEGAEPVLSPNDLLNSLNLKNESINFSDKNKKEDWKKELSPEEEIVLKLISQESLTMDDLVIKSKLSTMTIAQAISSLEIKNIIIDNNGLFFLKF